ncbi:putative membrane transporter protein [Hyphomicrobium sp. 1Nfss2.1]|uniref:sulfite exporter TauE/SafE family protein n=1 Tax=Hyphomicrobium sp. 1Nfss2.1 TaxID=3413936 RepID=UPI003C7D4B01
MELLHAGAWPLVIIGGFTVGFLVGLTGVGAGSLMTPFLISGIGISPVLAVGTDLLFASITKASAAWRHHALGNVHWPIVRWLATGSLPGATIILAWIYLVEPDIHILAAVIRKVLAFALVISALCVAAYPALKRYAMRTPDDDEAGHVRKLPTLVLGFVLGVLVALTSVGAGAIGVVALTMLYHSLSARRLIGTDIVHAIPLTFLAGASHFGMGNVDLPILGLLLVGSVPGIALGSRITGMVPDWVLRVTLALVLFWAAFALINPLRH